METFLAPNYDTDYKTSFKINFFRVTESLPHNQIKELVENIFAESAHAEKCLKERDSLAIALDTSEFEIKQAIKFDRFDSDTIKGMRLQIETMRRHLQTATETISKLLFRIYKFLILKGLGVF